MEGLSKRAYARHRDERGLSGRSESGVRKAIVEGRLKRALLKDGSIDPEVADQEWESSSAGNPASDAKRKPAGGKGKGGRAKASKKKVPKKKAPVRKTAVKAVDKSLKEAGKHSGNGRVTDDVEGITLTAARTAKAYEDAEMARLKRMQMEGVLIDREKAQQFIHGWMRQERDAWMAWPGRVASLLAADLDLEDVRAVTTVLERHVREHLQELSKSEPRDLT